MAGSGRGRKVDAVAPPAALSESYATIAARALEWIRTAKRVEAPPVHMTPLTAPSSASRWFILACEREVDAQTEAKDAGYPTSYLPVEVRTRVKRGRKVKIEAALFPGYLFVKFDRDRHDWAELEHLDNALGILRNNLIPVCVPDAVIEKLQLAESQGLFSVESPFKRGDTVEILEGAFAGIIARVKAASPRKRVKLLLDALGEADVDAAVLRKL